MSLICRVVGVVVSVLAFGSVPASAVVPDVTTGRASNVTKTGATLHGTDGTSVTSCRFVYADAAHFNPSAANPFAGGGTAACNPARSGSSLQAVTANVSGLSPDTVYRFRLEATSSSGTSAGAVGSLFVPGAHAAPGPSAGTPGLPDGRVYEQVSPENKAGGTAGAELGGGNTLPAWTLGSADGNSVFSGLLEVPGQNYGANNDGIQVFSVFTRSSTGWSARGVLPPQNGQPEAGTLALGTTALPSADFSSLAFGAEVSFGPAPAFAVDLVHPDGSVTWLSQPTISDPLSANISDAPVIAGGSADLSRIYFGDVGTLLPSDDQGNPAFGGASRKSQSTPANYGFYEWTPSGGLSYAGVLPDGSVDPYGAEAAALPEFHPIPTRQHPLTFNNHEVSADGSRAFFVSPAPQAGAPASDPVELYVRETAADGSQRTVLVSGDALTGQTASDSPLPIDTIAADDATTYMYASPDGSHVFFADTDALTAGAPNDGTVKEYGFDTNTNTLSYLPGVDDGPAMTTAISCDEPVFACDSPILTSTGDGSELLFVKETPSGDSLDLWSGGRVTPVAQLPEGYNTVVGRNWQYWVPEGRFTDDGSAVVFETQSPIYTTAPGEFNNAGGFEQVYRYVVGSGQLSCLSCGGAGVAHAGDAMLSNDGAQKSGITPGLANLSMNAITDSRGISDDGSRVFFDSPDPLLPQAIDGKRNVYEWEAAGAGSCAASSVGGCLYLLSTGQSGDDSFFLDNSASGNDVFFATSEGLVPGDTDGTYDIYDARVGGGFPSAGGPAACSGDACQVPPGSAPALPSFGTVSFSGPGDPASAAVVAAGRVHALGRTVTGPRFALTVRAPAAGTITVTGGGLVRATRAVGRAGTYELGLRLTSQVRRELRRRRRLRLMIGVAFAPAFGSRSATHVAVMVKA